MKSKNVGKMHGYLRSFIKNTKTQYYKQILIFAMLYFKNVLWQMGGMGV